VSPLRGSQRPLDGVITPPWACVRSTTVHFGRVRRAFVPSRREFETDDVPAADSILSALGLRSLAAALFLERAARAYSRPDAA
jgi:hypothetical protein